MPTLPSSLSYAELAGPINDYSDVVDPTTDLPAEVSNIERAAVAAMSRMVPRLYVEWSNDGTVGTVLDFDSVVGNSDAYKPTFTKVGTGIWRLTFSAYVTDLMGNSQAWNFRHATSEARSSSPLHLQSIRAAANIIDVYIWSLPTANANDATTLRLCTRVY